MLYLGTLLESGYLICGIEETCCDSPGAGGICCDVCEDCSGGACNPKGDNAVCGTGMKCCSDICIDILSDESNCGTCFNMCSTPPFNCCVNGQCVAC